MRRYRYENDDDTEYRYFKFQGKCDTVIPWMFPVADPFHFVTISAVCKYWRTVALDTPVLWTSIAPANIGPHGPRTRSNHTAFASAALTYLERARQRPLNLVIDRPEKAMDFEELLSVLDTEISSRLREIHCHYMQRPINILLNFPAPSLESLHLGHGVHVRSASRTETYEQREPLFAGVTPRLRFLSLAFLWDVAPKFNAPSLTHLHFHCSRLLFISTHRPNDCARHLFSAFPELVDLSLSKTCLIGARGTRPTTYFPKLSRFSLHEVEEDDIQSAMSCLAVPPGASVLLRGCKPLNSQVVRRSAGLADYFAPRPWTRVSVLPQQASYLSVIATDDHVGAAFGHARLHRDTRDPLCAPLPLQGIHECWLMEPAFTRVAMSPPEYRGVLRGVPDLRTLVVCPWNVHTVVDVLGSEADASTSRLCPVLRELRVFARTSYRISPDTLSMLDTFRQSRALERVVVCYLPGFSSEAETSQSLGGVEYVHLTAAEAAGVELPAVCTTEVHAFWPKWQSHVDVVFGSAR